MVQPSFIAGTDIALVRLFDITRTHSSLFIPQVPQVIHFPVILYTSPRIPYTIMMIMVFRLYRRQHIPRRRIGGMNETATLIRQIHSCRRENSCIVVLQYLTTILLQNQCFPRIFHLHRSCTGRTFFLLDNKFTRLTGRSNSIQDPI